MVTNNTGNLVFVVDILDEYKYLNIFKNNLEVSVRKLGLLNNFYFQRDSDFKIWCV